MQLDMNTLLVLATQIIIAAGPIALIFGTKFGERLIGQHFETKLETLKHEQNAKIEGLKTELAHVVDRGQRSNEREYDALSQTWEKCVDAFYATNTAIINLIEYPDLNQMSDEGVSAFLSTTDFSEGQRKQIMEAKDRNQVYSRVVTLRQLNAARKANHEARALLLKREIFIPAELVKQLSAMNEMLSEAEIERYVQFQHRSHQGEKAIYMLKNGQRLLKELGGAVRARLMKA